MTRTATKRQSFTDVPVKEVTKTLTIIEPKQESLKGHIWWVKVGNGKTAYTTKTNPANMTSGRVISLFNGRNNKTQRWEITQ